MLEKASLQPVVRPLSYTLRLKELQRDQKLYGWVTQSMVPGGFVTDIF